MNILGKFTIHKSNPDILVIHRDPGLLFWLFMLMYFGFVTCLNLLFFTIIWEARLPRTLTCHQQQQAVNCEYVIPGFIYGKTIKIPHTKKAIASQTPNWETIVLTSSQPWMVLEPTSNNIQNIQSINQGLAKLNNGEKIWKLDIYASYESATNFFIFFLLPLAVLLFLLGIRMVFSQGSTYLELDVKANTVSIINLGRFRSQLSLLNQLRGADSPVYGHLGILSDKFGIYGGDFRYRRNNYRKIRLLFTNRSPFILGHYQQILQNDRTPGIISVMILGSDQQIFPNDGGQEVIGAINSFLNEIESRRRSQRLEG